MEESPSGGSLVVPSGSDPESRQGKAFITDTGLAEGSLLASTAAGSLQPPPGSAGQAQSTSQLVSAELEDGLVALKQALTGTSKESQATILLKKRKDMRMVEDALETVKREFRERMERLSERQLRFEEKQKALQDMVAKFKPFIEENDNKRSRADRKAAEEAAGRARIEVEISFLARELETIKNENAALERRINRLKRYALYLEAVIAHSSSFFFESPSDVLAR